MLKVQRFPLRKKKKYTPLIGKGGATYVKQGALSFITLNFFDSLHYKPTTPDTVLRPGALYVHNMLFKFGAK
ncbi:hypothetical protein ONE63_003603 [Megalurothrips usitatus]|uniref:Uncharacterized protein n=1 Tax=Megalurothrips usitatus TaxID=439358 RepID=A0AAV7X7R7_9NEOP|nr:hypothetical protein ONE63_003603 [Megalurothrips usitatus]